MHRVHVIFVGKNLLLLAAGLRGWFLGTVDSRFRGNDSGDVGAFPDKSIILAYEADPALGKLPDYVVARSIEEIITSK